MEALGTLGGQVWIPEHPVLGWAPGTVESVNEGGVRIVRCDIHVEGEESIYEVAEADIRPVDKACLGGVDDLLCLSDFQEGDLLHNIRVRYYEDKIYTGIGGPILISVNPYKKINSLYSKATQKEHREAGALEMAGQPKIVSPHLFSVADKAFRSLQSMKSNQSIIISGESGAGKTEATKKILEYFASMQEAQQTQEASDSIAEQVLRSNPILEAFGNAKTKRNDNSSRFGKFIDIEFDGNGKFESAWISNYLLEKCRIVQQQKGERGFHSFYQLCAGRDDSIAQQLHLKPAAEHNYICGCVSVNSVDDKADFQEMLDCMVKLGFTVEERSNVFSVVAAVLHLGDLDFKEAGESANWGFADKGNPPSFEITEAEKAIWISEMLQVDVEDLKKVFAYSSMVDPMDKTKTNVIFSPQGKEANSNTRHSMAKVTYSRLFDWIVWRINQATLAVSKAKDCRKIGILDIFGFEIFEHNSFEQLCINFANEKLQHHFNNHMFTEEQKAYEKEGIDTKHLNFKKNNDEIINALEKKATVVRRGPAEPSGLFPLIDSECLKPQGKDDQLHAEIEKNFFQNVPPSAVITRHGRFKTTKFDVAHYAGQVSYDVLSFVEKNTDKLSSDILKLLKGSKMPLLQTMFTDPRFAPEARQDEGGAVAREKKSETVSQMFRKQLDKLVEDLRATNPSYIRCIKPNEVKAADDMNSIEVRRQLRCAGMLETIRIRKDGYPVRKTFRDFFDRYYSLDSKRPRGSVVRDYKALCQKILQAQTGLPEKSWQLGRSKAFYKESLQTILDKLVARSVWEHVLTIQKGRKTCLRRRRAKKWVLILAALRTLKETQKFREHQRRSKAALCLQATLQTHREVLKFREHQRRSRAAVCVQAALRGHKEVLKFREYQRRSRAAVVVQASLRTFHARSAFFQDQENKRLGITAVEEKLAKERAEAAEREAKLMAEQAAKEQALADRQAEMDRQAAESLERQAAMERQAAQQAAAMAAQVAAAVAEQANSASAAEVDELKATMAAFEADKERLQVELAASKTSDEYEELKSEADKLREEVGELRRGKTHQDLQLSQKNAQLEDMQARQQLAEAHSSELINMRAELEETQAKFQKIQAQKSALEDRVRVNDSALEDLQELRCEKMRLQSELELSQSQEEAFQDKLAAVDEKSVELEQAKRRASTTEADLSNARSQIDRLKEQVEQLKQEEVEKRDASLDSLRTELLGKFEEHPARGSALPEENTSPEPDGARMTISNARGFLDQMKKRSSNISLGKDEIEEDEFAPIDVSQGRERQLEEELRKAGVAKADLEVRLLSIQDNLRMKSNEADQHMREKSDLAAEMQDLKYKLDHEMAGIHRAGSHKLQLEADFIAMKTQIETLRRQNEGAQEELVTADEERKNAVRLCNLKAADVEGLKEQCQQLSSKLKEASTRERKAELLLQEEQRLKDYFQKQAAEDELKSKDAESKMYEFASENERLKGDLLRMEHERDKFKKLLADFMNKSTASQDMQKEAEIWKSKYNEAKLLTGEVQKFCEQQLNEAEERKRALAEAKKLIQRQDVELRAAREAEEQARREKDQILSKFDTTESSSKFFEENYKKAQSAERNLTKEHSDAMASNQKLRERVEHLQNEIASLQDQVHQHSQAQLRAGDTDSGRSLRLLEDYKAKYKHQDRNQKETIACLSDMCKLWRTDRDLIWGTIDKLEREDSKDSRRIVREDLMLAKEVTDQKVNKLDSTLRRSLEALRSPAEGQRVSAEDARSPRVSPHSGFDGQGRRATGPEGYS